MKTKIVLILSNELGLSVCVYFSFLVENESLYLRCQYVFIRKYGLGLTATPEKESDHQFTQRRLVLQKAKQRSNIHLEFPILR
jgi:hypothetical protein